jgi:hypothetical protein
MSDDHEARHESAVIVMFGGMSFERLPTQTVQSDMKARRVI